MIKIDFKTLILIVSLITLFIGFIMFLLRRITPNVKGPGFWAFGCILISLGLFGFFLYPGITKYIGLVFSEFLISLGYFLYLMGILQFKEKRIPVYLLWGIPLLQLALCSFFFFLLPSSNVLIFIESIVLLTFSILALFEMLAPLRNEYRLPCRLGVVAYITFGLLMIVRAILVVIQSPASEPAENDMNVWIYFFSNFIQILIAFTFILLVFIKISSTLKVQIATKNKLFNILAHDLKGPLSTIYSFFEFLKIKGDKDEAQVKLYLKEIEKLSESSLHLIENIAEWSHSQKDKFIVEKASFKLKEVVTKTINLLSMQAQLKDIEIIDQVNEETIIFADRMMLTTTIRNIISNAIKFTPKSGKITISDIASNTSCSIIIQDTGVGMDQAKIDSILNEEFVESNRGTTGETGTGLGLRICFDFTDKQNGKISIRSNLNIGTTIQVQLPND
jgi:two-component system, sensor histidine kinase and response regulator